VLIYPSTLPLNIQDVSHDMANKDERIASEGELGMVSIIIPTFNRALLLTDLLDSIAPQTYHSIEIIVIDDGSTDNTQHCIAAWASSHNAIKITSLRIENSGPAAARNLGLRQATGEYIYFIDSDDLIFPTALEEMVCALKESGRPYCLANIKNADIESVPMLFNVEGIPCFDQHNIVLCGWMTHGCLYQRYAILIAGAFNETLRVGEDTEHNWRVVAMNGPCHILDKTIGLRRIHNYGHLSIGRTDVELPRHQCDANLRFVEWASEHYVLNQCTARSLLRNILMCTIRLGAQADWHYVDTGRQAVKVLAEYDKIASRIIMLLTSPRTQKFYLFLVAAIGIARTVRNVVRWMRSRLQIHKFIAVESQNSGRTIAVNNSRDFES
jgi:glycosyltransferase involved in cell wall biosynthesis